MSEHWLRRPKVLGAGAARMRLTREERFLISRIDGQTSLADLGQATGLGAERVGDIVSKLQNAGAVVLGEAPTSERIVRRAPPPPKDDYIPPPPPPPPPEPEPEPEPVAELEPVQEEAPLELVPVDEPVAELEPVPEEEAAAPPSEETPEVSEKEDEVSRAVAERNYREVFEKRWHPLPVDARVGGAKDARGADLFALCFDPDSHVIIALLENATLGLEHVRLICFYHRTTTGIEAVARRHEWLRDGLVERRLLRNPMIGDIVLNRVMQPKRIHPTYKVAIDRDLPDLNRGKVRGMIRGKWQQATPEERAELMTRTEARCLNLMTGCTFDAKTTAILCGRPINSAMFVQSAAKFGATPPGLLAHLIKQPFVRKNPALKKMLLAHPNMPGDVKRSI